MRISLDIDEELMRQAIRVSGARTKKSAVEAGLRLLVQVNAQGAIRPLRGKVHWERNLKGLRLDRVGQDVFQGK